MKILICGDLHTKYHILEGVKSVANDYDYIIFLGDYVDEWDTVPEASYNILNSLIEFKKANPEKVILLLGNHDLSEWLGGAFVCSGYNYLTSSLVRPLFEQNEDLFDLSCTYHDILFSHAGLTKNWAKRYIGSTTFTAQEYSVTMNQKFHDRHEDFLHGLAQAGSARGGKGLPSPIWADRTELMVDRYFHFRQVVGHSPIETLTPYPLDSLEKAQIVVCDTHSLYPNKIPYGDNSLLEIVDDTFRFRHFPTS